MSEKEGWEEIKSEDREIMILMMINAEEHFSAGEIVKDVKSLVEKFLPYEVVSCGLIVPLPERKD